jgi:fructose 1,6-bisphosphatase
MKPEQSTIHVISANLGRLLGPHLPEQIVQAARDFLRGPEPAEHLRGSWVMIFGDDLHLHLTTCNGVPTGQDPATFAAKMAKGAALAALARGLEMGLGLLPRPNPLKLTGSEQEAALDLRYLDFPFTERGAEPIFVAKALNASWGCFNRALFNLYFNPDKGSGHRIEGNDFRAVVESVADLREGKPRVRTFAFGPAESNELLALVTDPDDWRLSEVYAVRGRFGEGKYQHEPAARVGGARDPVCLQGRKILSPRQDDRPGYRTRISVRGQAWERRNPGRRQETGVRGVRHGTRSSERRLARRSIAPGGEKDGGQPCATRALRQLQRNRSRRS